MKTSVYCYPSLKTGLHYTNGEMKRLSLKWTDKKRGFFYHFWNSQLSIFTCNAFDFLTRVQSEPLSLAGDLSLIYSAPDGLSRQEKDRWLQTFQWWEVEREQSFFLHVLLISEFSFSWKQFLLLQKLEQIDDNECSFSPLPLEWTDFRSQIIAEMSTNISVS